MGLPNGMERISRIAIGGVWRPSQIEAHVPSIDVSSGLMAMAHAKKAEGKAQAARAEADAVAAASWAKMTESFINAAEKVSKTYFGIKHEQKKDFVSSCVAEANYMKKCEKDPSQYQPDLARELHQDTLNKQKTYESNGFWRQSADTITEAENNMRILNDKGTGHGLFNRVLEVEHGRRKTETDKATGEYGSINDGGTTWNASTIA